MITDAESLLTLAEVAIALAGFSAIVVILKRGTDGGWSARDANRFHGMVVHAIFAVVFCFLPTLLDVVVQDVVTSLHIAAALLGAQIIAHAIGVMCLRTVDTIARLLMVFGVAVGLLQFSVFSDWGVHREMHIYSVGIIWHILQAGLLFVLLVWVPPQDMHRGED